jgi:hypothetical protein
MDGGVIEAGHEQAGRRDPLQQGTELGIATLRDRLMKLHITA